MMMMIMMMMFAWGLTALSAQPRSPHGPSPYTGQYYITVPSVLQPVCSSLWLSDAFGAISTDKKVVETSDMMVIYISHACNDFSVPKA